MVHVVARKARMLQKGFYLPRLRQLLPKSNSQIHRSKHENEVSFEGPHCTQPYLYIHNCVQHVATDKQRKTTYHQGLQASLLE